MIHQTNS